jgi:hypothetical protein
MEKQKQNSILAVILVCMVIGMAPQVIGLWQIVQLPVEEMFSLPQFWGNLGLLLLIPTLLVAVTLSLPQLDIKDRDMFQKPLVINLVAAGVLQLVAAWQAFPVSSTQASFYILVAVFSFTAPSLLKQIRTRLGS